MTLEEALKCVIGMARTDDDEETLIAADIVEQFCKLQIEHLREQRNPQVDNYLNNPFTHGSKLPKKGEQPT